MEIEIDEKFIEESRQMAMRLSKSILSMERFMKRHDEVLGLFQSMIGEVYLKLGMKFPDYKFKTEDPYGCPDEI